MNRPHEPALPQAIEIRSPLDYQVFQRDRADSGCIRLDARVAPECGRLEYRLHRPSTNRAETAWSSCPLKDDAYSARAELRVEAGGWYALEFRLLDRSTETARTEVPHVGVGDIFIGAGQSNSTSCGECPTRQVSGMVANFTGDIWRYADDPQLGSVDEGLKGCGGGSYYPAFGDALSAATGLPVGISPTGCTGQTIRKWEPGVRMWEPLIERLRAFPPFGFRAVLWHQGESDIDLKLPADEYYERLKDLILRSRKAAGWEIPWFVARASYPGLPADNPVRTAQERIQRECLALEGPDTDPLADDHRDRTGVHFSRKGLKRHGELWAEKVLALLPDLPSSTD